MVRLHDVEKNDDMYNRLDTIPACDRRTDGQINILPRHSSGYAYASLGKIAMKKFDFTPKNFINCVHNEPALWDTECTDVYPEITARIDSYHWLSFLEV